MSYEYENDYGTEIKSLATESYAFGGTDAYTEIWDHIQAMKRNGSRKGHECTSGYFYIIEQLEKFVDAYFNWSGSSHYNSARTKILQDRTKNISTAVDNLIDGATKAGYLVPQIKVQEREAV